MIGTTYSTTHYDEFKRTGNQNIFEEIIDRMILDGIAGMNESFRNTISNLPIREKRMTILSLLDKDLNLFKRIKALISNEKITKIDHLKEVILMLREYVKVGPEERKKFGEVFTDLNLVKHILSRIPEEDFKNPNKTFLDLANGTGVFPLVVIYRLMKGLADVEGFEDPEFRYKHIVENQIFVSEIQPKNMFLFLCLIDPYDEYDLNIYCGSSLDDGFRKHMKEVWKKNSFSYSIGNPPFNQNVDLKFLKLSHDVSENTIIIHPSVWLIDNKLKNKTFQDCREYINDRLYHIELLNCNKIFNIGLFVPCSITYITKYISSVIIVENKISRNTYTTNNINDIDLYDCNEHYLKIKNKIKNYCIKNGNLWGDNCKRIYNGTKTINDKKYEVGFSPIRGHVSINDDSKMVMDDFYTFIQKKDESKHIGEKTDYKLKFGFDTLAEAENFLNYLKSNFARFSVSIYKTSQTFHGGELEVVPWLDFTQEWTDEKLYKYFDLTEEEIKFIEKNIPKYY
jgi:hypothetical protein